MKTFETLINETLRAEDLDELESAADLFQYGVEKGYYNKRQADEFNNAYWKVKNKCLAYEVCEVVKGNTLDIITIVSSAPSSIKDDKTELLNYVNSRLKAIRGKMGSIR